MSQAKQLAAAAILRSSDLPGYSAKPQSHTARDVADENAALACLGLPTPAHYLARDFGTALTKGTTEVDSSADVAFSTARGQRELAALKSPKEASCFKQQIGPALASSGLSVKSLSTKLVPVQVPGADATFAYTYTINATAHGHLVHIGGYEVGALVGQVEVDLTITGLAPIGVTLTQAQQLAATSVSRVRAAAPTT